MPDVAERSTEERLEEATRKLTALETAAWELLSALESGDPDEIAKAKRRLGAVFLDL
jgi:hypothetical protein